MTNDPFALDLTPAERIEQLETQFSEMREQFARGLADVRDSSGAANLSMGQHNPFVTRSAGRIIIEIPFDDSIDASNPLECFFQMPRRIKAIRSAQIWVQRKSFRAYETGAASGGSSSPTSSSPSADHGHTTTAQPANTGVASPPISDGHWHGYNDATAQLTSGANLTHTHTVTIGTHTHTITYGIFETAAAGTMSLFVADDGTNYGSAIVSGVTSITGEELKAQLTKNPGDKRIKITATGLMRVQVLLILDVAAAVMA